MIVLGRFLSPFVRRVATTLELYDIPYENRPLQHTGDDVPTLRESNPVGRVPALVLDDGDVIVDSSVILDHLDRRVGPDRALTPATGKDRDRALSLTSIACGAVEKAIATAYEERFRPEDKRHAPWVERCAEQARGGFAHLENQLDGDWFMHDAMSQIDVTTAICWQFMGIATPELQASIDAPRVNSLSERLGAMDAFKNTYPG